VNPSPHAHSVTTMLRSIPLGRGGAGGALRSMGHGQFRVTAFDLA